MRNLQVMFFALVAASSASAEETAPKPRYTLRTDQVYTGSADKFALSPGSPYPLKKRYEDFTSEEKATLRAMYDGMPDTDDPPFPAVGMRYIVSDVSSIVSGLRVGGSYSIFVNVDAKGTATGVRIMEYPDLETAKAISYVLVKTKFKPALCGGSPCELEFPFRFFLKL